MSKEMLSYKNGIRVKVKELEAIASRLSNSIKIVKGGKRTSNNDLIVENYTQKLNSIQEQLDEQQRLLDMVNSGDYSVYEEYIREIKLKSLERQRIEKAENIIKAKGAKKRQQQKDATYKKARQERRGQRWDKKKHAIYYGKFCRAVDTLPDYMKNNLKQMPNNKGYLWRGISVYGEKKPIKDDPVMLFEKRHGTLWIHKYFLDKKVIEGEEVKMWRYETHKKPKDCAPEIVKVKFTKKIEWETPPGAKEIEYASPPQRNNHRRNNDRNNRGGNRTRYNNRSNTRNHSRSNKNRKKRDLSSWG